MIDIHCHILPGLDDGAQSMDEAIAMARIAVDDGITTMVATPHYWEEHYTPTPQQIRRAVAEVQDRLAHEDVPLKLLPGQEVMMAADVPERMRRGDLVTLADGGDYLLIDLPTLTLPLCTEDVVLEVMALGVTPIIAHPEKNADIRNKPETLQQLVQHGCLVQMDADSLTGSKLGSVGRFAARALNAGLVHILATDGHCPARRPPLLSPCVQAAGKIVSPQVAEDMATARPAQLIGPTKVTIRAGLPTRQAPQRTRSTAP